MNCGIDLLGVGIIFVLGVVVAFLSGFANGWLKRGQLDLKLNQSLMDAIVREALRFGRKPERPRYDA